MPRKPDYLIFTLKRFAGVRFSSYQEQKAGTPEKPPDARSSTTESASSLRTPETGVSFSRLSSLTIEQKYQAFEALPNGILQLPDTSRASLLGLHQNVMSALRHLHTSRDSRPYTDAVSRARDMFNSAPEFLAIPLYVKEALLISWDVLYELSLLRSDIENSVRFPNHTVSENAINLLTMPSGQIALNKGVLALFLCDITHALQGNRPYSFPDLVKLTTSLDQRPQNAKDFKTWQSLLYHLSQNNALSDDFLEIFGILFTMLGYYPRLTFEEQCFYSLTQDQTSLPPYFNWFRSYIVELYANAKGLLAAGLGEIVFRSGKQLSHAFNVLPKDFFAPWPVEEKSTFRDSGSILDNAGNPLTFLKRSYGMYWESMGDLLRHPNVTLNQALQAAQVGLLVPWSTWYRYAQGFIKHQDAFWNAVFPDPGKEQGNSLTIRRVCELRTVIYSLFSTQQEGWLRYLRWCNDLPLHVSHKLFDIIIDSWNCIKAVREHCTKYGLADVPVALWYFAPFEMKTIPEFKPSDFLNNRLRNLLVSLWQVDFVFFHRDPERYKALRRQVFGESHANSVGGLVCHLGLEQLSPIFQNPINAEDNTRGVLVINSNGTPQRRRVTVMDLCAAANVEVATIEINGVTYEHLVSNPTGQSTLDSNLLKQINLWVNISRRTGDNMLSSTGGTHYCEMGEVYDIVTLFYLLYWESIYGAKRTQLRDKMAAAPVEPVEILSRLKPLRYDTHTGQIDVDGDVAIAGPRYGMGPLKVYEEVMRIVTEAPYGTTLHALSPEVSKQVLQILNPRPVKDAHGNYVRVSQDKLLLVVPVADSNYQDPNPDIPPGFMNYEDYIRFPSRSLVNILEAISRGNPACRVPCPSSDLENKIRRPMPLSKCFLHVLLSLAEVSPEHYIREAFRLAHARLAHAGGDVIVQEAERIWNELRFYNKCGPADMHRFLQHCTHLPPWFIQLVRDAFHLDYQSNSEGTVLQGHVGRLYEALHRAGIQDQELANSFRLSSGEQVAAEFASAAVRDFVPVGGNIFATFLGLVSKFQETMINLASQSYRFSLPAVGGTFGYLGLRSLFPYGSTDWVMWGGIGFGFVWYFGLLLPRYFVRSRLRRLTAFAHACGLHNPPLEPKKIADQFTSQVNNTYVTPVVQ